MNLKEILKNLKLSEQNISMALGALVIIIIGVLLFNFFRGLGQKEVPPVQPTEVKLIEEGGKIYPQGLPTTHKVEKGEHLWSIAEKYYGSGYNWVDIARENKLGNPNRIFAKQQLTLPKAEVKKPAAELTASKFGQPISGSSYTVAKGDHLWGIAIRAYQDGYRWVEITKANKLANPNLIHPGNILTLPR